MNAPWMNEFKEWNNNIIYMFTHYYMGKPNYYSHWNSVWSRISS